MDIGFTEAQIESIECESEEKLQEKASTEERIRHFKDAIAQLADDAEVVRALGEKIAESEEKRQAVNQKLDSLRDRVTQMKKELLNVEEQTAANETTLAALAQVGEDISESMDILKERQQLIAECVVRLQGVMERLKVVSGHADAAGSILPVMENGEVQQACGISTLSEKDLAVLAIPPKNRSPYQSERADELRHPLYTAQTSFAKNSDGKIIEVPYGTRGSQRPDQSRTNEQGFFDIREIKDYHNVHSLKRNMTKQARERYEFFDEETELTFGVVANTFTIGDADRLQIHVEDTLDAGIEWILK